MGIWNLLLLSMGTWRLILLAVGVVILIVALILKKRAK
jgi:hypothetical protein